ncbi:olfactory receptor 1M1-like [Pygocentrus nattereri]|uniref:olfactory receptor 1M1-like n=1 Tax=Pygocentrus nattereri TaxID=42514 RepID=UPI0008148501|nr:olfactory receptor 1M1-like [Pygocentrus nattereri]
MRSADFHNQISPGCAKSKRTAGSVNMNSSLLQNVSFVRPEYFYISGFSGIPFVKYYFIFLFVTYFIAVFGNSFVLIMIMTDRSLHVPKYMAIFNLALADFGETNALIPNLIKTFLFDSQYISYNACLANMFFVFFFISVQSLTLVVLAYDRYIAIRLPLRYHAIVNNSLMSAALMAVWSFSTLVVTMMVSLITRLSFCKTNEVKSYFCDHGPIYTTACNDNTVNSVMAKLWTVLFIYGPLIAVTVSYIGIFIELTKITTWEGRLKALKTCFSHMFLVGIFLFPILSTYIAALTFTLHPNARIINTSLSSAIPPMVNPIIYVLNTKEFKDFIVRMLKRRSKVMVHVLANETNL